MKGTELFVKALQKEGIDFLFAYPGGYAIDIFDELYKQDSIQVILPRHEQGLVHAADGYARATGRTGVCLVTSGPGATNLVTGIATANYDSVPLVCFTGQVPTSLIGNDAFQEVDIVGITRSICKYAVTVRKREDLGRIIKEAFYIANTGKKGPVVVDLPKDIMLEEGDDLYPKEVKIRSYKPSKGVHIGQLKKANSLLSQAKKPLFLMGGGVNISGANEEAKKLAELTQVPVITTIMGKGALPTNHELYIGNVGMHGCYAANHAISECDLLFSIGTRFNDRITGKIDEFAKNAKILQIDVDPAEINKNIQVDCSIIGDLKEVLTRLNQRIEKHEHKEWIKEIETISEEHPLKYNEEGLTGPYVIEQIYKVTEGNAIITTDVGQHQMWAAQYYRYKDPRTFLSSGGLGTMGYGVGAAIGAKVGRPDKVVLNIAGDGCFRMNMNEIATAARYNIPIIQVVINNHVLGMVRQWQTLFYGKRYSQTILNDGVDFVKVAEALGAEGIRVTKKEEVAPAVEKAIALGKPVVIDCVIDCDDKVFPMVPAGAPIEDTFDQDDLNKEA